ncbi:MAG: VWA domain-containing protein [Planctomycetota bacterium]
MSAFRLEPIYGSPWAGGLAAVAIVAALVLLTPPTTRPRQRRTLICLRIVAAICVLLVTLRPSLVRTDNRPSSAALCIAVDVSQSMQLPGSVRPGSEQDRWTQQSLALQQLMSGLDSLSDNLRVVLVRYGSTSDVVSDGKVSDSAESLSSLLNTIPKSSRTDLAAPLQTTIDAAAGSPIAGIALFGDGVQTATTDRNQETDPPPQSIPDPQRIAKLINAMGVPLWTVPIGPPSSTMTQRDVAIRGLPDEMRLFAGNRVELPVEALLQGVSGIPVDVVVSWIDAQGKRTIAAERTVTANEADALTPLSIPVIAPEPGLYRLQVQAETQSGETLIDNNTQTTFADVREGGGRVLYVEGSVRLEQTYLTRSLESFPDLELTYRWIPRDTNSQWPIDFDLSASTRRYDVVILGDLHAKALGDRQLNQIVDRIDEGGALITLGGPWAYGTGGYASSPLNKVFPVNMNDTLKQSPDAELPQPQPGQTVKPIRVLPITDHRLTRVNDGDRTWESLPALPGANRWRGTRAAPGVQVLLADRDSRLPLLVIGEYGRGRVASLAMDSTWQWHRSGAANFHRRFWRQLLLWSLARDDDPNSEVRVELSRRRAPSSGSISFEIMSRGEAASSSDWTVTAVSESGQETRLAVDSSSQNADGNQVSRGRITDLEAGFYRLQVRSGERAAEVLVEKAFQIENDTVEMTQLGTDHGFLKRLSQATADVGGQSYRTDEIEQLLGAIGERRLQARETIVQKRRLGDGPGTGWPLFVLFAGSLCSEWFLRRRWGLA